jgi:hypothetical protein
MECSGVYALVININLIVHFGEKFEIAYYYTLKLGRERISNRFVEGTLKQKMVPYLQLHCKSKSGIICYPRVSDSRPPTFKGKSMI